MVNKNSPGSKNKPQPKSKWRSRGAKLIRFCAASPLAEVAFISSFILARWRQNSDFSYPSEIAVPILCFAVVVSAIFYVYKTIFGDSFRAHLASLPLTYFGVYLYQFTSGGWLGRLIFKSLPHHFATPFTKSLWFLIALGLAFGLVSYGINRLIGASKTLQELRLNRVLLFAIAFVFVAGVLQAGQRLWNIRHELSYQYPSPALSRDTGKAVTSKPDIYFLMPEDYASAQVLKDVNNYDNSSLYNFLSDQGFVNRQPVAYSSYPFTMSSLASDLAMNYFPEFGQLFGNDNWQTGFPYRSVINNPPITQVLKENGYSYNQVSSWWDFSRINIKADSNPSKGYRLIFFGGHYFLSDLSRDIVNKSILLPWLKKGVTAGHSSAIKYDLDYNPKENLSAQFSAVKHIASRADKSVPQFTFGHFMVPHTPFIFDADGSDPLYDGEHNDEGVAETVKYANQVAYFNTQIKDLVSYIRANSPDAVIIIQSDEGSYPPQFRYIQTPTHYYDPINLPVEQMRQKFSILASYYMPGVDPKLVSEKLDSSVNVFRFVLDQYLGYSLPNLPSCNFATGNKFKVYNYQLVTDKLGGKGIAACKQYQ